MNHQKNHERYLKWWGNRSDAETALALQAFEYEEKHFDDLRLQTPRIRNRLLRYEAQFENGEWHAVEDDVNVTIDGWIIRYQTIRGLLGRCDSKRRVILIRPKLDEVEQRATLLHEMIHAYESQLTGPYREWLLLDAYGRLSKRIAPARLQRYMCFSTHSMVHSTTHGLLFLLKSLELDMKFGWRPGTVFGYGRDDYFAPKKRTTND